MPFLDPHSVYKNFIGTGGVLSGIPWERKHFLKVQSSQERIGRWWQFYKDNIHASFQMHRPPLPPPDITAVKYVIEHSCKQTLSAAYKCNDRYTDVPRLSLYSTVCIWLFWYWVKNKQVEKEPWICHCISVCSFVIKYASSNPLLGCLYFPKVNTYTKFKGSYSNSRSSGSTS